MILYCGHTTTVFYIKSKIITVSAFTALAHNVVLIKPSNIVKIFNVLDNSMIILYVTISYVNIHWQYQTTNVESFVTLTMLLIIIVMIYCVLIHFVSAHTTLVMIIVIIQYVLHHICSIICIHIRLY